MNARLKVASLLGLLYLTASHWRRRMKEVHVHVTVNVPGLSDITERLDTLLSAVNANTTAVQADIKENQMQSQEMTDMIAQVTEAKTTMEGAATMIASFSQRLEDAGTDRAKLAQLRADLQGSEKVLHDAIVANTDANNNGIPDRLEGGSDSDVDPVTGLPKVTDPNAGTDNGTGTGTGTGTGSQS